MMKKLLFLFVILCGCSLDQNNFFAGNLNVNKQPVRLGYFHGVRAYLFYRIHFNDGFKKEGVDLQLYYNSSIKPYLIKIPPTINGFDELELKYPQLGRITGPEIIDYMINGQLDGGIIGESSFITAATNGVPLTAVARLGTNQTNLPSYALLLRKNVTINNISDFKGKKIGVRQEGPLDAVLVKELFSQLGVEKDVIIVKYKKPFDLKDDFINGKLDGGFFHFNAVQELSLRGFGYLYRKLDWIDAGLTHTLLVFRNDFIKKHPELIDKIVTAYLKRLQYENKLSEEERTKLNDTGLTIEENFKEEGMAMPRWDLYPSVDFNLLKQMQTLMLKHGAIEKEVDLSPYINNSFVDKIYNKLSGLPETTETLQTGPNIIIISMDTLRADHLSCYGYPRSTSPNIDKFAKEGTLFSQAISQASWTLASNSSILTGQYVPTHGMWSGISKLPPSAVTLAEVLQLYGYKTAAFTGGFHISSIYGLNQGFDTYFDRIEHGHLKEILPEAYNWLNAHQDEKFFMFLQAYECHAPYELPQEYQYLYEQQYNGIFNNFIMDHALGDSIKDDILMIDNIKYKLTQGDKNYIVAQYDASINYMDNQIGTFLDYLEKSKLANNSVVIFLGSHGEALAEHGYILKSRHGGSYEEGIHVPLIIKLPLHLQSTIGNLQSKIDTPVQLIDVMPTILELLNRPIPHQCQGESVWSLINGSGSSDSDKFVFSSGAAGGREDWQACIRNREWKLIEFFSDEAKESRYELYYLPDDPTEQKNLIGLKPEIVGLLKERLKKWADKVNSTVTSKSLIDPALRPEMQKRMRERGYWWLDFTDKGGRPVTKTDKDCQFNMMIKPSDTPENSIHKFSSEVIIIEEPEKQLQSEEIIIK